MHVTIFSHPDCASHDMDPEHPEAPARLAQINDQLIASGLDMFLAYDSAEPAPLEILKQTHCTKYIDDLVAKDAQLQVQVQEGQTNPHYWLDDDTLMMPNTWRAARLGAGCAIAAVDEVLGQGNKRAFCAVRPPGHHARYDAAMGFCILANVSLAAHYALNHYHLSRVAIVDFDVHHGNGTEDIVQGDPQICFYSSYQADFYPFPDASSAQPNVMHTPLAMGTDGQGFREAVGAWFTHLHQFQPELIIISAGFDAHAEDPLAHLRLKEADYYWVTQQLAEIAEQYAKGRMISMLEGGYDLSALGRSVAAHIKALIEN